MIASTSFISLQTAIAFATMRHHKGTCVTNLLLFLDKAVRAQFARSLVLACLGFTLYKVLRSRLCFHLGQLLVNAGLSGPEGPERPRGPWWNVCARCGIDHMMFGNMTRLAQRSGFESLTRTSRVGARHKVFFRFMWVPAQHTLGAFFSVRACVDMLKWTIRSVLASGWMVEELADR